MVRLKFGLGQVRIISGGEENTSELFSPTSIPFPLDIKCFLLVLIFNLHEMIVCKTRPFIFTTESLLLPNKTKIKTKTKTEPLDVPEKFATMMGITTKRWPCADRESTGRDHRRFGSR